MNELYRFYWLSPFNCIIMLLLLLLFCFNLTYLDCLDNTDCATGASCTSNVCGCNAGTPVLVGDSASDTAVECVECTSSNFGSCEPNDSCDTSTNLCVGMYLSFL